MRKSSEFDLIINSVSIAEFFKLQNSILTKGIEFYSFINCPPCSMLVFKKFNGDIL
jgi:hypothetical protein